MKGFKFINPSAKHFVKCEKKNVNELILIKHGAVIYNLNLIFSIHIIVTDSQACESLDTTSFLPTLLNVETAFCWTYVIFPDSDIICLRCLRQYRNYRVLQQIQMMSFCRK